MKACEKIAAIQQSQHIMRTPPYACIDGSDAADLEDGAFAGGIGFNLWDV